MVRSNIDYKTIRDMMNSYAVNATHDEAEAVIELVNDPEALTEIYEEVGISQENRDINFKHLFEFDVSDSEEAEEAHTFLSGSWDFEGDVCVHIANLEKATEEEREKIEMSLKPFHETHFWGPEDEHESIVLVSDVESLVTNDYTLSGRTYNLSQSLN